MGSLVKAVEVTHDRDDLFELEDRVPYKGAVFPRSSQQVNRPIKIGRGAQVDGPIFGRVVSIINGFSPQIADTTRTLSIFGIENVNIGDFCNIGGHVTSAGELSIGASCIVLGNVIAPNAKFIGHGTRIEGNLISMESVTIADNVQIGGYVIVLNGELFIGKNSKAHDIIASGEITMDDNVTLSDSIVWSNEGNMKFSKVNVGYTHPVTPDTDIVLPKEINPYLTASNTCDYQKLFKELKSTLKNQFIEEL